VGSVVLLERDRTILIGRDVSDGLRLRDTRVSRVHVRIAWDASREAFRYSDSDSANGVFMNGRRASGGFLTPHDVMRVGDSLLVCIDRDLGAEARARALRVAPAKVPVLIRGETGTGKELLARAIHDSSGRTGVFVPINCAALPPDLAATELFGHTRGAFSGANTARPGLFRAADGGTLLLDEVGDLPLELQGHLLRVLQEGRVRPVGADRDVGVDARIVAATHVDLDAAVRRGSFREDLLSRLAQVVLVVPPLRARRADILRLTAEIAPELSLTPAAAEALLIWDWPRNVRELGALLESHRALHATLSVRALDLKEALPSAARVLDREGDTEKVAQNTSAVMRRERLSALLKEHDGNVAKVARELGKPRAQIYRWLKALGLDRPARAPTQGEDESS
jgi:DNA-binding NtrC family response regulator